MKCEKERESKALRRGAKKSKKVGSSPVQVTTSYLSVPELKSIAQGSGATFKPAAKADVGRREGGPWLSKGSIKYLKLLIRIQHPLPLICMNQGINQK